MEAKTLRDSPGRPGKVGDHQDNGVSENGTTADYLTARIARDCPEVHEAMMFTVARFRRRTGALSCTYRNA